MLIPGHVGFTLGIVTLIQKARKRPPLTCQRLFLFSFVALLPDILDRSLHWLYPHYPDHLLFHSLVVYALALLVLWRVRPLFLACVGVMAFHAVLDFVDVNPRFLLWPVFGWGGGNDVGHPLVDPVMNGLPSFLSVTVLHGHYLIFEVAGILMILWAIGMAAKARKEARLGKEPAPCRNTIIAG